MHIILTAAPLLLASTVVGYYTENDYFTSLAIRSAAANYYDELAIRALEQDVYNTLVAREGDEDETNNNNNNHRDVVAETLKKAGNAVATGFTRVGETAPARAVATVGGGAVNAGYNAIKFGASHKGGKKLKAVGTVTGTMIGGAAGGGPSAAIPVAGFIAGPVIGAAGATVGGAIGYCAASGVHRGCKKFIKKNPKAPTPNAPFANYNPRIGKRPQTHAPQAQTQGQVTAQVPNTHVPQAQATQVPAPPPHPPSAQTQTSTQAHANNVNQPGGGSSSSSSLGGSSSLEHSSGHKRRDLEMIEYLMSLE